ncbi:MAG: hypothetical protein QM755_02350 [Luteolibacter sp.]
MPAEPTSEFSELLESLVDGTASSWELFSLAEILQANTDLRRQAKMHLFIAEALSEMGRDSEE